MKTVKRLKWEKKLTAKEVRHIRDWPKNLRGLKIQLDHDRLKPEGHFCWECRMIGRKLGLID